MERNINKIKIAPSILSADFSVMGEEVKSLQASGADLIHVDVMDGVFVPNITFGIKMVEDLSRKTTLELDTHLMIVEPWKYIEKFAAAGSAYLTVHYEACGNRLEDTIRAISSLGVKSGLVINPNTPVDRISHLVELCDMVLLMSVCPGFGGQKFISDVLPKISLVKSIIEQTGKAIELEVDGGINFENVSSVKKCGANVIVAGNTVFKADDRSVAINKLRNL